MIYDHHALYDDDDSHDDDADDDETTDSTLEAGHQAQWRRPEALYRSRFSAKLHFTGTEGMVFDIFINYW